MMIGEGMKVAFVPACNDSTVLSPAERRAATITGKVAYINHEHRYFTVEYGCGSKKQYESFNFHDVGKAVTVYGN